MLLSEVFFNLQIPATTSIDGVIDRPVEVHANVRTEGDGCLLLEGLAVECAFAASCAASAEIHCVGRVAEDVIWVPWVMNEGLGGITLSTNTLVLGDALEKDGESYLGCFGIVFICVGLSVICWLGFGWLIRGWSGLVVDDLVKYGLDVQWSLRGLQTLLFFCLLVLYGPLRAVIHFAPGRGIENGYGVAG